ncbi:mitogen activated protein kinase kinase kinase [Ceratobasidium sp. AG-Ba]|nr:mitogen activated protein kinase kinase kinase [Ceratobasidium sp. AG-Ba]
MLPPQASSHCVTIIAVTHDREIYNLIDISGQTDAKAIRKRILTELHIPEDLRPYFEIYRTELGGSTIGDALDDDGLLIDCQHFGDDRGSLKFLAQRVNTPTDTPSTLQ